MSDGDAVYVYAYALEHLSTWLHRPTIPLDQRPIRRAPPVVPGDPRWGDWVSPLRVAPSVTPRPPWVRARATPRLRAPWTPTRRPVAFDPQPITLHLTSRGLPPTVPFSDMEEF